MNPFQDLPGPSTFPAPVPAAPALGEIPSVGLRKLPPSERPRERLIRHGPEGLRIAELLGLLLRTGIPGADAVAVGDALHRHFGSLATLNRASHAELARRPGVGPGKAALLMAAFELGRRVSREALDSAPVLDTPARIAALLADTAAGWKAERMVVLLLNTRCRLIRMETVTEGLIDQVLVHPREIFRPAIAAGAHSIVLVHNHPSGDPSPSEADIRITREILRAGLL
ncbi:MAG: DNA repair protein RadC, partial [Verrucomicrobiota bacterium]